MARQPPLMRIAGTASRLWLPVVATAMILLLFLCLSVSSFVLLPLTTTKSKARHPQAVRSPMQSNKFMAESRKGSIASLLYCSSTKDDNNNSNNDVASLRIADIKVQLQDLGVDYRDCFDKESLVQRLIDARQGKVLPTTSSSSSTSNSRSHPQTTTTTSETPTHVETATEARIADIDLDDVRAMSVKELRSELASRNVRWAGLLEKRDLVQAVIQARLNAARFSVTGLIAPGQVADLTADQVQQELSGTTTTTAPFLLLDVYAVWCGPCQMMAPILQQAAASPELSSKVRVAKMDSDKYPELAGRLRVQGLPTLILFRCGSGGGGGGGGDAGNYQEVDRIEGAMMKDQLVQWVLDKLQ